ncbi:TolC family outer membrane protein [Salinisphaera sp.]|uniref:TolC family outer membrane protein n=1 Tax=Salinisphaera sp. TaxID=1914330 RepID=UPI000C554B46|nr:TolC family outer membrane protein [Salinisphaera sp.]MAS09489.1 channel protein TolC [Salinisphaera sp.]
MKAATRTVAAFAALALWPGAAAFAAQNLLDTYDQALRNDTELLSARAESGAASARYRQARGQLLPQLSATANYSQVTQDQRFESTDGDGGFGGAAGFFGGDSGESTSDQQSYSLDLTQPLFNWTAWQNKDAAAARSDEAALSLSMAEQQLIVRVAEAYFDVLAARDALTAAREQQRSINSQLDRAQAAFEAGLDPITDQQEAQSSLDSAIVDAIDAENQLAASRDALIALTGRAPDALSGIDVDEDMPDKTAEVDHRNREDWLAVALERSPQVAASRAAWRAAREDIAAQRGGHLPTLNLVGSVGRSEQLSPFGAGSGQLNIINETQSIGLQLEMPLFSGGATRAAVSEAEYNAEQARLDLIAARRQLLIDINDAHRSVATTARRLAALDRAIASGETALEAAQAGYRLGNRTILDVIEAQITLVQRRADRKQAWYDHALARLRLRRAAGVLDFNELARINARLRGAPPQIDARG